MFVFPSGQSSFAAGLIHFTSPAVRAPHMGPHCTLIYEALAHIYEQTATCTVHFLKALTSKSLDLERYILVVYILLN